jgi:hypothetical protein
LEPCLVSGQPVRKRAAGDQAVRLGAERSQQVVLSTEREAAIAWADGIRHMLTATVRPAGLAAETSVHPLRSVPSLGCVWVFGSARYFEV